MTVGQVSSFKGDIAGHIDIQFNVESLEAFLTLLNTSRITKDGYLLTFAVEEWEPGKGYLMSSLGNS